MFRAFKIGGNHGMWNRAGELGYHETVMLADIVRNNRNLSSLTDSEKQLWNHIGGRFAHALEDGSVVCDIAVFENGAKQKFFDIIKKHPLSSALLAKYQTAFDETLKILKEYSNPVLHQQLNYCASMFILDTRMMIINDEVSSGRLTVPADAEKSTTAMYLELR